MPKLCTCQRLDCGVHERPLICARPDCSQPVRFSNTTLCEDHWADQAQRYHGHSQRVTVASISRSERRGHEIRQRQIRRLLAA